MRAWPALPFPIGNAATRDTIAMTTTTSSNAQRHCKGIRPVPQKKLAIPGVPCVPTQPS